MAAKPKKGILLLSSGIDSPVAGYLMLKQGVEIIAVHFQNSEAESQDTISSLAKQIGQLSQLTHKDIPLIVVPNYETERLISENTNHRFQCLLCKRMMYRVAEKLAEKYGCDFIITGENLGQVASQTLENLAVLNDAIRIPLLRPLLCNDKNETIRLAEQIGTFEPAIKAGKCPFLPKQPLTAARLEEVEYEESKLQIDQLVSKSVSGLIYTN